MRPPNTYYQGLYIEAASNGFIAHLGGQDDCVRGEDFVFRNREELAAWVLSGMPLARFERPDRKDES
jgi:hypothetical protein